MYRRRAYCSMMKWAACCPGEEKAANYNGADDGRSRERRRQRPSGGVTEKVHTDCPVMSSRFLSLFSELFGSLGGSATGSYGAARCSPLAN